MADLGVGEPGIIDRLLQIIAEEGLVDRSKLDPLARLDVIGVSPCPTPPIVRTCASLHADQAARTLLEKREQLAATKLAAYENPTALVDTMDLEHALCEVDTPCSPP